MTGSKLYMIKGESSFQSSQNEIQYITQKGKIKHARFNPKFGFGQ